MMIGLMPVDRGRIELEGCDITRLPRYRRAALGVGDLPRETLLAAELNVEQSILESGSNASDRAAVI